MPEPRSAFRDLEGRVSARPIFEHVDNLPSKPRRTPILDYLMGWLSPQWPKADPKVCRAIEAELGLEHWFSESRPALQWEPNRQGINCECRGVHTCTPLEPRVYRNRCQDCGLAWESKEADYLCAECHEKEIAELEVENKKQLKALMDAQKAIAAEVPRPFRTSSPAERPTMDRRYY